MPPEEQPAERIAAKPATPTPRATSMDLLTSLIRAPLDPAYHAAAEAKQSRAAREDDQGKAPLTTVGAAVVAVILGVALGAGTVHLQSYAKAPTRDLVRSEILERQESNENLAASNEELTAQINDLREVLHPQADRVAVEQLSAQSGSLAVTGPGIRVVVSDPETSDILGEQDDAAARVLDKDLQVVVNSLWVAGAEAVSVGGERLTGTSAIRQAGEAILVNYSPLVGPYEVRAVGEPERLRQRFEESIAGSHLSQLRDQYGISSKVSEEEELELPAAPFAALREAAKTAPGQERGRGPLQ